MSSCAACGKIKESSSKTLEIRDLDLAKQEGCSICSLLLLGLNHFYQHNEYLRVGTNTIQFAWFNVSRTLTASFPDVEGIDFFVSEGM
jgi:hypothetical protein